eukprot:TRINITY_DN37475_c0_g1_i3.p1 TRINITY_DN37475_c0_g1~~TRINITY_DN37475_c0_g1_i3.p1  ORF type:complete len:402 (+),score=62.92 TRINITY_DN37475_c0_g1_i3:53-1258(+)
MSYVARLIADTSSSALLGAVGTLQKELAIANQTSDASPGTSRNPSSLAEEALLLPEEVSSTFEEQEQDGAADLSLISAEVEELRQRDGETRVLLESILSVVRTERAQDVARVQQDMSALTDLIERVEGRLLQVDAQQEQRVQVLEDDRLKVSEEVAALREELAEERRLRRKEMEQHIHVEGSLRQAIDELRLLIAVREPLPVPPEPQETRCQNEVPVPPEPQETETERRVREVELNGNIEVDLRNGRINVLRPIEFVPRRKTDLPTADLADPSSAQRILDDIASVQKLFNQHVIVEGHTRGGESEFWQVLADDRARLVGDALEAVGVPRKQISTRGLPGKLGMNKVDVVVLLGSEMVAQKTAPAWPSSSLKASWSSRSLSPLANARPPRRYTSPQPALPLF